MLTLIKNLDAKSLLVELPAFGASLLTADYFYKFHSFTLECLAFLGTWALFSFTLSKFKAAGK
jgi:hypothetical protein